MQDFVHLHVHTQYSILDGQASIPPVGRQGHGQRHARNRSDRPRRYVRYQGVLQLCQQEERGVRMGEIKDLKKRIAALEKW